MSRYFKNHSVVLLDTCTLREVSGSSHNLDMFWLTISGGVREEDDIAFVVSDGVLLELDKQSEGIYKGAGKDDAEKVEKAKAEATRALAKLHDLVSSKAVRAVKDHVSEPGARNLHADRFFVNMVNNFKTERNVYVLTQDVALMKAVYQTEGLEALAGHGAKEVKVYKVPKAKRNGAADPYHLEEFRPYANEGHRTSGEQGRDNRK